MSNDRTMSELLSAYFDDEVTPEERESVERFVEESADARRDLQQFAGLSELLVSLPQESAPQELLPTILRRAERESLLPIHERPAVNAKPPKRNSWLTIAAGIVATAAVITLTVQFLPERTDEQPARTAVDRGDADSMTPANVELADARDAEHGKDGLGAIDTRRWNPRPGENREGSSRAVNGATVTENFAKRNGTVVAKLDDAKGNDKNRLADEKRKNPRADSLAGSVASLDQTRRSSRSAQTGDNGLAQPTAPTQSGSLANPNNVDALQQAQRGDVLQYFDNSGTKVTTYMVTVVDVNRAIDKLQVLLARHEIPAQGTGGEAESEQAKVDAVREFEAVDELKAARDRQRPELASVAKHAVNEYEDQRVAKQADRLFAVYVETTPGQFASALKDLLNDETFAQLHPKPPVDEAQIEVAGLGDEHYRQLFRSRIVGGRRPKGASPVPTAEQGTAGPGGGGAGQAVGKKELPKKPVADAPPAAVPVPAARSATNKLKREPDKPKEAPPADRAQSPSEAKPQPARSADADKLTEDLRRQQEAGFGAKPRAGGPASFYRRVQLAPRLMVAGPQSLALDRKSESFGDAEIRESERPVDAPVPRRPVDAPVPRRPVATRRSLAEADAASTVRVLFVFRESAKPASAP